MTGGAAALLAGYRDFSEVARGRDAVLYRAHRDVPGRVGTAPVAVKVVQLDDPDAITRLGAELADTVRVSQEHPNIASVLDTGLTSDGYPCLVTDYAELGSLHDRLVMDGPLPIREAVAAASDVADALAFAHAQGVLHSDVTPRNILAGATNCVLADVGLARAITAAYPATSRPRFDYRHASPQLLDGAAPTVADDVYGLGSTIFTLLDGRAPFTADDPGDDSADAARSYQQRARTEAPRNLARTDVPDRLGGIIARCLAKRGTDRFAGAAELRAALATVLTETIGADPTQSAGATRPAHDPTSLVTLELPVVTDAPADPPSPTPAAAPPARPRRWYDRLRPGR